MAEVQLVSIPTDGSMLQPSCGFFANILFPMTGILSSGESLGIFGAAITYHFFLPVLKNAARHSTGKDAFSEIDNDFYEFFPSWLNLPWVHQQESAIEWLESRVNDFGLDGRLCGLRFACEMQYYTDRHFSIIGDVLSVLFSQDSSEFSNSTDSNNDSEVLRQYASARGIANDLSEDGDCSHVYKCPISIFRIFKGNLLGCV